MRPGLAEGILARPVRLAAGSPRAVARPGLPQIRTCPIKASGSSGRGLATPPATRRGYVYAVVGPCVPAAFPPGGPATRRPLPSPGSPWGGFPGFLGTMRRSDPCRPSRPAHWVRGGGTAAAPAVSLPTTPGAGGPGRGPFGVGRPAKAEVRTRRRRTGLPGSWGTPMHLCRVLRPRRDPAPLALAVCQAWPPLWQRRRLSAGRHLRGSIARLRRWLSTLRPRGHPRRAQDSLPAVG